MHAQPPEYRCSHREFGDVVAVQILGELAVATGHATSARAATRAVCETFARHGVTVDATPELAVVGTVPSWFDDAFREAARCVLEAALLHVEALRRVAGVSRRAHVANRELREEVNRERGELVTRSEAMRSVMTRIELVAKHPTTVLVLGESGTGKEVVTREIHRRSPRARQPLVQLDCGALPEALIEAELFGHERGAFTGAERARAGVFERAHGGTLMLDEIGELPLAAQAKLLRVLQERRIRRVGGEQEIEIDVRLIAATNRSLASMMSAGTFREDLFYRLDGFAIQLPPLRARPADLGPLVVALVGQLARKLAVPAPAITQADLATLAAHNWPGNVRELGNVLETAMILGGHRLELPPLDRSRTRSALSSSIRDAIEEALEATRGKIYGSDGAARRLGLPPATLQSKMKKLGIDRSPFATRRRHQLMGPRHAQVPSTSR
jgi:formate hydrogenlyase transcriptional activator